MTNTKIITVTLSPWLDRTLVTHHLALGYENLAQTAERLDPAGEGVNISRALQRGDQATHAIILLGSDATARAYRALCEAEGLQSTILNVEGPSLTNTYIMDTGQDQETLIKTAGPHVGDKDIQSVIDAMQTLVTPGDMVVLAGPLPSGAPDDTYAALTDIAHASGAEVVVSTTGAVLGKALAARPELVAISQVAAEGYLNYPVRVLQDVVGAGRKLCEQGAGKALIEMREDGQAALITREEKWLVNLPDKTRGTSAGIWEALLAGFLAGRLAGKSLQQSLVRGGALAAYTADEVGTKFGSRYETRDYDIDVEVTPIEDEGE